MQWLFLKFIQCYQQISWLWPKACRFYPSCSCYAQQSISQFGARQGVWLTLKRLAKCHPLHPGGVDLPPQQQTL